MRLLTDNLSSWKMPATRAACLLFVLSAIAPADDLTRRISEPDAKKATTKRIDPEYPSMARQIKLAGRVQVDAFIEPDGTVEKVHVLNGNPLLTSSAVAAVKRWKFTPFIAEGKPTKAVATFTFDFRP